MKISGIYKIQSKIKPNRTYIGSAICISQRWRSHLYTLKKNKHHCKKLQNHFNKYGETDLQFSILLGCDKEYLIVNEQFFIDSYKPYFNICQKAGSCLGVKHSSETRLKTSLRQKGNTVWLGRHHSDETKKKLSGLMMGKLKGIKRPKEVAARIAANHIGNKLSEETKRKISLAHKGKPQTEEHKRRLSEVRKGRVITTEHKNKTRESLLRYFQNKRGSIFIADNFLN